LIQIFIDADGCPVKNEVYKVAQRYNLKVFVVSNSRMKIPQHDQIELVVVENQFDAADNWIVDHITETGIGVTADILLAARVLQKGALALDPKGRVFDEDSIGGTIANREIMSHLRQLGSITGGPAPFEKKDRSRFLERLDYLVGVARKLEREAKGTES
jgi:hypothetical protein